MDLTEKTNNLKRHPWELSRSYNIMKLLENSNKCFVYADIGAGDKFFTSKLLSITNKNVFAIDIQYNNKKEDRIICLNDVSLLENNSIDCIIMMDVLEHIENDSDLLKVVFEKIKPNGKIIITVPAMQFLFSSHDVFIKHQRRYNRKQLMCLLQQNKMKIEQCYYFYSVLFIIRSLSFLIENFFTKRKKKNTGIGEWKHSEKSFITKFFIFILNIDFFINKLLNKIFIRLPGLSILAICKK